ncbi:MAG TPA: TRL domain-containing protein [Verrucomicrobiae bacterium]
MTPPPRTIALALAILSLSAGCSTNNGPIGGVLLSNISGPVAVTSDASKWGYNSEGSSSSWNIFGLISIGDASIDKAKRDGASSSFYKIKVTHVDYTWKSFLGVGKYTVKVYFYDPEKEAQTISSRNLENGLTHSDSNVTD